MKKKLVKILTLLLEDYPKVPSKLHWVKFFRSNTLQITPKDKQPVTVKSPIYGVFGDGLLEVKQKCDEFIDNDPLTPAQLVDRFDIITIERLLKAYDNNRITPTDTYIIRIRDKDNSFYETYIRPELKDKSNKEIIDYFKRMIDNFNNTRKPFEAKRRVISVKRHVYKFHNYYLKETQIVLK
jgi:hypothetical protein